MNVYERIENGAKTIISVGDAMSEVNAAMMGHKHLVREMSSGSGQHSISYTDGRNVRLTLVDEQPATNLVNFRGGKVHTLVMIGQHAFPECKPGMGSVFDWTETASPITCRTCLMYERRRDEAK